MFSVGFGLGLLCAGILCACAVTLTGRSASSPDAREPRTPGYRDSAKTKDGESPIDSRRVVHAPPTRFVTECRSCGCVYEYERGDVGNPKDNCRHSTCPECGDWNRHDPSLNAVGG